MWGRATVIVEIVFATAVTIAVARVAVVIRCRSVSAPRRNGLSGDKLFPPCRRLAIGLALAGIGIAPMIVRRTASMRVAEGAAGRATGATSALGTILGTTLEGDGIWPRIFGVWRQLALLVCARRRPSLFHVCCSQCRRQFHGCKNKYRSVPCRMLGFQLQPKGSFLVTVCHSFGGT